MFSRFVPLLINILNLLLGEVGNETSPAVILAGDQNPGVLAFSSFLPLSEPDLAEAQAARLTIMVAAIISEDSDCDLQILY